MANLTINNSLNLTLTLSEINEISEIIHTLSSVNNKTAATLIAEQDLKYRHKMGYLLGSLKANLDCLPEEIASRQRLNNIPLNLLIKIKVDEFVLDIRETLPHYELTFETDYEKKYRRLSELICGFGYNMTFLEDRFEQFFPNGIHKFVLGFAVGYSKTFHEIAELAGISIDETDPKTQDIWKNWEYFLKRDIHEYRLDGNYLFMYHGGYNCSGDKDVPYGDNRRYVNKDVYEALKSREPSQFVEFDFDFKF